jgi:hypothetical protein
MTKEQIIQAVGQGKKVFVNDFQWIVKFMHSGYYIVNEQTNKIFCNLLNDEDNLVLANATYRAFLSEN